MDLNDAKRIHSQKDKMIQQKKVVGKYSEEKISLVDLKHKGPIHANHSWKPLDEGRNPGEEETEYLIQPN